MCDYFWKKMENGQGDLADIVRASGRAGGTDIDLPSVISNDWQFIPSEVPVMSCFPLPSDHGRREDQEEEEEDVFSDPFGPFSRDPLLHEITVSSFFDHGQDPKRSLQQEITRSTPNSSTTTTTTTTTTTNNNNNNNNSNNNTSSRPCDVFSRVLQISPGVSKPSQMIRSAGGCQAPELGDIQISSSRTPGIKRRKSQAKKVVCIPAPAAANSRTSGEVVPSDLWAWRKYGQKPIKGSPYPRGYYRCSSSKGCSARKQVERSRTDPNMLVITYTSEHNHPWPTQRNALAGSTRSQTSKNITSSSSSSSTQKNNLQKQVVNLKQEPKDTTSASSTPLVKEEGGELVEKAMDASDHDQEFHQMFVGSYKPMIPECNHPDDFFADLAELDPDPMSLIFSKGIGNVDDEQNQRERNNNNNNNNKSIDPFNIFDWGVINSFGESKRGL